MKLYAFQARGHDITILERIRAGEASLLNI
jgi:hypothetical protein